MALSHTRILSHAFRRRIPAVFHLSKKEFADDATTQQGNAGPYRPSPFDAYFFPRAAKYWLKEYPAQPANKDEYFKEEVYLDEIEQRMKKYDKSWNMSDRNKALYNEFGWQNEDDRAFYIYGGGLSNTQDELQYGRGKKIDPAHYINPDFNVVLRKPIPPIQYMTNEQIRQHRGSLANYRQMIPEQPSLLKFWNGYSALTVFGFFMITKELYVLHHHDFTEALLTWCTFGCLMSIVADWIAWMYTLAIQEEYDREFFPLQKRVDQINKIIETLVNKPNEQQLLQSLVIYRDILAEKVLQKTLSNRINNIMDQTLSKLQEKLNEETSYRKNIEELWKKEAKDQTNNFFNNNEIRTNFMDEALNQFMSSNLSLTPNNTTSIAAQHNIYQEKYQQFYNDIKNKWFEDQKGKGTLNWVFASQEEKEQNKMTPNEKKREYEERISQWARDHNDVNVPAPTF